MLHDLSPKVFLHLTELLLSKWRKCLSASLHLPLLSNGSIIISKSAMARINVAYTRGGTFHVARSSRTMCPFGFLFNTSRSALLLLCGNPRGSLLLSRLICFYLLPVVGFPMIAPMSTLVAINTTSPITLSGRIPSAILFRLSLPSFHLSTPYLVSTGPLR